MFTKISVFAELQHGGQWLSRAREWLKSNVRRGDTLYWSSAEPVSIPFCKFEEFALTVAIAAVAEERTKTQRPGSQAARFAHLVKELEKRFPHPNPFDSAKPPELYMLEAIDRMIASNAIREGLNNGWQMWNGEGEHPSGDVRVAYRMLDGCQCDDHEAVRAGDLDWTRTDARHDWEIAAFKIIPSRV